jgi:hypothetical protein
VVFAQRPLERRTGVDRDQSNARPHAVDHSGKEPCRQRRRYSATRRQSALVAKGGRNTRRQHCSFPTMNVSLVPCGRGGAPTCLNARQVTLICEILAAFYPPNCYLTCQSNSRRVSSSSLLMPMPFGFRHDAPQQVWLTSRIALPTDGLAIARLHVTEVNASAARVML